MAGEGREAARIFVSLEARVHDLQSNLRTADQAWGRHVAAVQKSVDKITAAERAAMAELSVIWSNAERRFNAAQEARERAAREASRAIAASEREAQSELATLWANGARRFRMDEERRVAAARDAQRQIAATEREAQAERATMWSNASRRFRMEEEQREAAAREAAATQVAVEREAQAERATLWGNSERKFRYEEEQRVAAARAASAAIVAATRQAEMERATLWANSARRQRYIDETRAKAMRDAARASNVSAGAGAMAPIVGPRADMSGLTRGIKRVDSAITMFARRAVTIGGLALGYIGAKAVITAGKFEQAEIAFTTMLGSATKATNFLEQLKEFAATTPFEFSELQDQAKRLMAVGFAAKEVLPTLNIVGDAVSAIGLDSGRLNRVILALSQMRNASRVTSQDMRQLTEAGLPAWDILAKQLGIARKKIRDAVTDRDGPGIAGKKGFQAIMRGMDTRYDGMMKSQATTLLGMWSNFKDRFTYMMIDMGDIITRELDLKHHLGDLIQSMQTDEFKAKAAEMAHAIAGIADGIIQATAWMWKHRGAVAAVSATYAGLRTTIMATAAVSSVSSLVGVMGRGATGAKVGVAARGASGVGAAVATGAAASTAAPALARFGGILARIGGLGGAVGIALGLAATGILAVWAHGKVAATSVSRLSGEMKTARGLADDAQKSMDRWSKTNVPGSPMPNKVGEASKITAQAQATAALARTEAGRVRILAELAAAREKLDGHKGPGFDADRSRDRSLVGQLDRAREKQTQLIEQYNDFVANPKDHKGIFEGMSNDEAASKFLEMIKDYDKEIEKLQGKIEKLKAKIKELAELKIVAAGIRVDANDAQGTPLPATPERPLPASPFTAPTVIKNPTIKIKPKVEFVQIQGANNNPYAKWLQNVQDGIDKAAASDKKLGGVGKTKPSTNFLNSLIGMANRAQGVAGAGSAGANANLSNIGRVNVSGGFLTSLLGLIGRLRAMASSPINFLVNIVKRVTGNKNTGGMIPGLNSGGEYVPGGGDRDTQLAWLTPGEFVLRKEAAQRIGANRLQHMNLTGEIPRYAKGGTVEKETPAEVGDKQYGSFINRWRKRETSRDLQLAKKERIRDPEQRDKALVSFLPGLIQFYKGMGGSIGSWKPRGRGIMNDELKATRMGDQASAIRSATSFEDQLADLGYKFNAKKKKNKKGKWVVGADASANYEKMYDEIQGRLDLEQSIREQALAIAEGTPDEADDKAAINRLLEYTTTRQNELQGFMNKNPGMDIGTKTSVTEGITSAISDANSYRERLSQPSETQQADQEAAAEQLRTKLQDAENNFKMSQAQFGAFNSAGDLGFANGSNAYESVMRGAAPTIYNINALSGYDPAIQRAMAAASNGGNSMGANADISYSARK